MIKKPHSSVWDTTIECWDDFLNDPEISRAIETVREASQSGQTLQGALAVRTDETIGERLSACETPMTEEILRQSIK